MARSGEEIEREQEESQGKQDGEQGVVIPGGVKVAVEEGEQAMGASAAGTEEAGEGVDGAGWEGTGAG